MLIREVLMTCADFTVKLMVDDGVTMKTVVFCLRLGSGVSFTMVEDDVGCLYGGGRIREQQVVVTRLWQQ
ncbi:hypothetical protein L1987_57467 [Smallanthus sonchifolius]|uniref:Uncharacterized protein n=1 Tax=Smallanthus sonchifolius TaxID=185202 RepID=A0ACB9DDJ9_9ASTR|nr:hypothetical protein L1987_57467 [Smallanthus sonchifolius]